MQIVEDPSKMQEIVLSLRHEGKRIALVSTSGALHPGHRALVDAARDGIDVVVLSTIVNPLEFGPNEDYERYPRNAAADIEFCKETEVDILFAPSSTALFPPGFSISVSEASISRGLCGISRPNYFSGVCTLHAMLFNLVRPDRLMVGKRDSQKSAVLKKLIRELGYSMEVVDVDTVREPGGLACSARNGYLNEAQRRDAAALYKALQEGKHLVDSGISNVDRILAEVTHHISQVRRLRVIYVAAVHPQTMEPVRARVTAGETLLTAAVWCDEVRLVDNLQL